MDTCSTSGSIALFEGQGGEGRAGGTGGPDGGRLVAELTVGHVGTHSEWLMDGVKVQLESAGWRVEDIDLLALAVGPGSFTGLRIGVSVLKGLAWAMDKPVFGVSTLQALSMNLRYSAQTVCPLLDARKGEVYTALYKDRGGAMAPVLKDCALRPEELIERVLEQQKEHKEAPPTVFVGDGLRVYAGVFKEAIKGAVVAPAPLWLIRASNIAELALKGEGKRMEPGEISPVYLRKSEAEIKRVFKGGAGGGGIPPCTKAFC